MTRSSAESAVRCRVRSAAASERSTLRARGSTTARDASSSGARCSTPVACASIRRQAFAAALGQEPFIAAVDSRGGQVVIHGWKTAVPVRAVDAVRALSPHVGAFLATLVDGEGMLGGLDRAAARELRAATDRQLIAAGGIRDLEEVAALDAEGIDAVVGMAIYTGRIK